MAEYFDSKMVDDLRTLRAWRDKNPENFATEWLRQLGNNSTEAAAVEAARRRVKGYFVKAARLYSNSLISKDALRAVAFVNGLNIFYDVVVPLGLELNADASRRTDELLSRELGRYDRKAPQL